MTNLIQVQTIQANVCRNGRTEKQKKNTTECIITMMMEKSRAETGCV